MPLGGTLQVLQEVEAPEMGLEGLYKGVRAKNEKKGDPAEGIIDAKTGSHV